MPSVELTVTDPQVLLNRSSLHGWRDAGAGGQLSVRQTELLQLFADGKNYAGAAICMGIHRHTVRNYAAHILEKMDAETMVHAVAIGLRLGLIT